MADDTAGRGAAADAATCQPAFRTLCCASSGIKAGGKNTNRT